MQEQESAPGRETTFQQRAAERLRAESAEREEAVPPPNEAPDGYPQEESESEAVGQDQFQETDADVELGALDDDAEALEEEAPEEELSEDDDEPDTDWKKRYQDLQSHTQGLQENADSMVQEHAQLMTSTMETKYKLDDALMDAMQRAEFMRNAMTGNADQFRNINWSQVPPERLGDIQAQAQAAFAQEQRANEAFEQVSTYRAQQQAEQKQREADIAKIRLRRTIPNWGNETYNAIREFAVSQGMPNEAFNDITDPVIIEQFFKGMTLAGSKVQKRPTKQTPNRQRTKSAKRQPRSANGQFQRAKVVPNERGSFAAKHEHRLRAEREGR